MGEQPAEDICLWFFVEIHRKVVRFLFLGKALSFSSWGGSGCGHQDVHDFFVADL